MTVDQLIAAGFRRTFRIITLPSDAGAWLDQSPGLEVRAPLCQGDKALTYDEMVDSMVVKEKAAKPMKIASFKC
jgi:hypothetical protein